MPVVFLAAVEVLAKVRAAAQAAPERSVRPFVPVVDRFTVPYCALVAAAVLSLTPQGRLLGPDLYRQSPHAAGVHEILARVPDGAVVEDRSLLGVYLAGRADVYGLGGTGPVVPEYVLDVAPGSPPDVATTAARAEQRHPGTHYATVLERDGYVLLRRA
jgi:hypothetical protein